MKTAVSIPDQVFHAAEQTKRRLCMSRSQLYARALEQFVRQHRSDNVTEALDRIYADAPHRVDPILARLQSISVAEKW